MAQFVRDNLVKGNPFVIVRDLFSGNGRNLPGVDENALLALRGWLLSDESSPLRFIMTSVERRRSLGIVCFCCLVVTCAAVGG